MKTHLVVDCKLSTTPLKRAEIYNPGIKSCFLKKYFSTSTALGLVYQSIAQDRGRSFKSSFSREINGAAAGPGLAPLFKLTLQTLKALWPLRVPASGSQIKNGRKWCPKEDEGNYIHKNV